MIQLDPQHVLKEKFTYFMAEIFFRMTQKLQKLKIFKFFKNNFWAVLYTTFELLPSIKNF